MIMMARRQILPAVIRFTGDIASASRNIREAGGNLASSSELLSTLCSTTDQLSRDLQQLETKLSSVPEGEDPLAEARFMHDSVLPAMEALRKSADTLEQLTDRTYWPFPTYDDLLFSV
jgi:glutamine synthetase